MRLLWIFVVAAFLFGCDQRTPEEKGKDYAEDKIGFVEGAADVLADRGKKVGETLGKGVGDLIKGAGSSTKDVLYPPVKVKVSESLVKQGIAINKAHEGKDSVEHKEVVVFLSFGNAFDGRLRLEAFDANGVKMGRAELADNISQAAGSVAQYEFKFPADIRMSQVDICHLESLESKKVSLSAELAATELRVNQLKETKTGGAISVSVYGIFKKAYKGAFQLRAFDTELNELGRSEPTDSLEIGPDSAKYLDFKFDHRLPLTKVASYILFRSEPKPKSAQAL